MISPVEEEREPNGFEFADDTLNPMLANAMPANVMPGDPYRPLINHPHLPPPSHFGLPPANVQPPFNLKIVKREINNATLNDEDEYSQQRRR